MYQQNGYIHKIRYYLAIKRNRALAHSTAKMNLENIMFIEINQKQKARYLYDSKY